MKKRAPSPVSVLNTCLLLLLIYLTLRNRRVGQGNAARLDSNRAVVEMEAGWQRRQANRLIAETAKRWERLYADNPQLRARPVNPADLREPEPTPPGEVDTRGKEK